MEAWEYCIATDPEKLQPHFEIRIELAADASCTREQMQGMMQKFRDILGVGKKNRGSIKQIHNTVICRAQLYLGYEAEICRYLREFISRFINSPENTFLLSIGVWKNGVDVAEALSHGRMPDFDAAGGYFKMFRL